MQYFSYNDYMDYSESGKIDKVVKVEEKIEKYERLNGTRKSKNDSNKIIEILREKREMQYFLNDFFNFDNIEDINYCNHIKSITDKETKSNIIFKSKNKEIYIFIKVIENIDINISYKMLEHSINIIKRWEIQENKKNKRYPIVIPIVIYTGKQLWERKIKTKNDKINYVTFEDNSINFSYNMINISELNIKELHNIKSKVAKEIIKIKKINIYK